MDVQLSQDGITQSSKKAVVILKNEGFEHLKNTYF
jgi:hypothetical protein